MSQQPSSPSWRWDPDSRQYYYYDSRTDTLVFQNGVRAPRPQNIPRTAFTSAGAQAGGTPSSSNYQNYPARLDSNYTTAPPNQSYPVQSSSQRQSAQAQPPPQPHSQSRPGRSGQPQENNAGRTGAQQGPRNTSQQGSANVDQLTQGVRNVSIRDPASRPAAQQPAPNANPVQSRVRDLDGGHRIVDAADTRTLVRTMFQTGPAADITDERLLESGIPAYRKLFGFDDQTTERLFDSFRKREQPRKFFTVGKVFLILWVEPAGDTLVSTYEPGTSLGRFGEMVYSKVRRFVVIREADTYASCLPITTYGRQGVGKRGVKKSEHSIIHSTRVAPEPLPGELPARGEQGMRPQAIRVDVDNPEDKLEDLSRLDYGKVHTIQHNIKVKTLGKINPNSMSALKYQFGNVWNSQTSLGEPGSSTGNSVSNAPPIHQRGDGPSRRRDSRYTREGASGGSHDDREPPARRPRPREDDDDEESDGSEHGPESQRNAVLAAHARAAVQRLIDRGYTQAQAINAIRSETARRRQAAAGQGDDDDESDDDGEAEEDDEDEDEDEEGDDEEHDARTGSSRRSERSEREEDRRRTQRTRQVASSHTNTQTSSRRQPARGSGDARRRTPSQQATARSGNSAGSLQGQAAARERDTRATTSANPRSPNPSQAPSQTQLQNQNYTQAQVRAQTISIINDLRQRGYSDEEAARIARDRMESRRNP